jgi:hypothetical protein
MKSGLIRGVALEKTTVAHKHISHDRPNIHLLLNKLNIIKWTMNMLNFQKPKTQMVKFISTFTRMS